eukprot:m.5698 g.5698  ORF g.5698 m.5698 type:complete len:203 (-) comp5601_c0_seq1:61-669(-)
MNQIINPEARVCITVTLLDGIVAARSHFHHSVNYRSVVIFGSGTRVTDPAEELSLLKEFVNHIIPNRWETARKPTPAEMKTTMVATFDLNECQVSAKVRAVGPADDASDIKSDEWWAGVIPLKMVSEPPILQDSKVPAPPPEIANYKHMDIEPRFAAGKAADKTKSGGEEGSLGLGCESTIIGVLLAVFFMVLKIVWDSADV